MNLKKVENDNDVNDVVYLVEDATMEDVCLILKDLCDKGYDKRKFSCCGVTSFYIHLFNEDHEYAVIDTDSDI